MSKHVKFIRKNGKIVPIKTNRGDGDKNPPVKHLIKNKAARQTITGIGAAAGAIFASKVGTTLVEKGIAGSFGFLGGTLLAGGISGIKYTKRSKGETRDQAAIRASMGNRKFNRLFKKQKNK